MKEFKTARMFYCTIAALVILFTGVGPVHAAMLTVNTSTDEYNTGAGCSLREAIQSVNNSANYGGCVATVSPYGTSDTINIPAGTYTVAIGGSDDLNANGDFDILNSVSIVGAGAASTTINGGNIDRVFNIANPVTVAFSGVTITGGNTASGAGGGIATNAGGTLTVNNCIINSNTAAFDGGGIFSGGALTVITSTISGNTAASGGGISNTGTLNVNSSTISGNTVTGNGGGIESSLLGALNVANSTISGNTAAGFGGGIYSLGEGFLSLTVTNSTISGNTAANNGGGGDLRWCIS